MGSLKNKALKANKEEGKKFTLSETQINTLMQYREVAQVQLDQLLQQLTSVYLHELAVSMFGYASNSNLGFQLELDKPQDNITITEV
jgi:hypothetical protein